jgi:hypothetical protein
LTSGHVISSKSTGGRDVWADNVRDRNLRRRRAEFLEQRDRARVFHRKVRVDDRTIRHVRHDLSALAAEVELRAVVDEELHYVVVAAIGSAVQRRVAVLVSGVDVRAQLKNIFHGGQP